MSSGGRSADPSAEALGRPDLSTNFGPIGRFVDKSVDGPGWVGVPSGIRTGADPGSAVREGYEETRP